MESIGQVGLGIAGSASAQIVGVIAMLVIPAIILISSLYYLPDIVSLVFDFLQQRDHLSESEQDRRLEGRLFDSDRHGSDPTPSP